MKHARYSSLMKIINLLPNLNSTMRITSITSKDALIQVGSLQFFYWMSKPDKKLILEFNLQREMTHLILLVHSTNLEITLEMRKDSINQVMIHKELQARTFLWSRARKWQSVSRVSKAIIKTMNKSQKKDSEEGLKNWHHRDLRSQRRLFRIIQTTC